MTEQTQAAWNTGRMYGTHGQRIAARLVFIDTQTTRDAFVAFFDVDREIWGMVHTPHLDETTTPRDVRQCAMSGYDANVYQTGFFPYQLAYGWEAVRELTDELRALALAVRP
jgi:hypothetical protein